MSILQWQGPQTLGSELFKEALCVMRCYSSHIIIFFPSYLLSYWIFSYLEALSYSWWTSFIWSLFGLVDIIIRFKGKHMINTYQTHICHMVLLCITVQCCMHSLLYCITHSLSFHLLSLSFNLHSLFILLTNHAFHFVLNYKDDKTLYIHWNTPKTRFYTYFNVLDIRTYLYHCLFIKYAKMRYSGHPVLCLMHFRHINSIQLQIPITSESTRYLKTYWLHCNPQNIIKLWY